MTTYTMVLKMPEWARRKKCRLAAYSMTTYNGLVK
jgi:hypothetical protein